MPGSECENRLRKLRSGETEPTLWRLHIKQEDRLALDRCQFCIDQKVAGVGWESKSRSDIPNWAAYEEAMGHKVDRPVQYLHGRMQCGDLVWTRNTNHTRQNDYWGKYWLGRVIGDWEYRSGNGYDDADIHNLRCCEWKLVGDLDKVPGAVLNAFRPRLALQPVLSCSARMYSMCLFNRFDGHPTKPYILSQPEDISKPEELFDLFSPEDCEDLVGIYLQLQGWVLHPHTCKSETLKYEFAMKDRMGRYAVVQVKTGQHEIDVSQYEQFDGLLYLFQPNKKYKGVRSKASTTKLCPNAMKQFCLDNVDIMPETIRQWVEWWRNSGDIR